MLALVGGDRVFVEVVAEGLLPGRAGVVALLESHVLLPLLQLREVVHHTPLTCWTCSSVQSVNAAGFLGALGNVGAELLIALLSLLVRRLHVRLVGG